MAAPVSQLFTINEPIGSVSYIAIDKVFLYFSSIGNMHGVDVQIRTVANGVPTLSVVENSRVSVHVKDTYSGNGSFILKASSDGTVPTMFAFSNVVLLQNQTQYALCVLPQAGDPAYKCWGAKLNDIDTLSQVPVQFNQSVGPLFYYSDDLTQAFTTDYAIKFLIEKVSTKKSRLHNDNYCYNEEHILLNDFSGAFLTGEQCYMSELDLNLAFCPLVSNVGSFINGEAFYQSNGTSNVAIGYIYSANASVMLLDKIQGTVDTTYRLVGVSSGAYANLEYANTQIVCSSTNKTVTFPFTGNNTSSLFYANQSIYLTNNDGTDSEVFIVTSVSSDNKTIQIMVPPFFSDLYALAGIIRGDGLTLKAYYQGYSGIKQNNYLATFNNSTANTYVNPNYHFGASAGCWIIGITSRQRCMSYGTIDLSYHYAVPQMIFDNTVENDHKIYWGGYQQMRVWISDYPESYRYDTRPQPGNVPGSWFTNQSLYYQFGQWEIKKTYDQNYQYLQTLVSDDDTPVWDYKYSNGPTGINWNIGNETENIFSGGSRKWQSRSNELVKNNGRRSVWMRHRCVISNPDVVPDIDPAASYITLITNLLYKDEETYGYRLSYNSNYGYFLGGDIITQYDPSTFNNVYGQVFIMDTNYIYVNMCSGQFIPGLSVYNANTPTVNAYITSSTTVNEMYSANVFPGQSRYMCKSIVLADGQDAEDMRVYLGGYRPANTNWKVYGKLINGHDTGLYGNRIWSKLQETNLSSTLFSSSTNLQDNIEMVYALPTSKLIFSNTDSCGCLSTSTAVLVPYTNDFNYLDYVYLTDPSNGSFNVRQVIDIPDNATLTLSSNPSFSNTTNVNIGVIPSLEEPTAAFLYDQNNNIVRYVTLNDVYFDSYKQFAIKLVPTSDDPVCVPRLIDFRALALQAG